MNKLWYILWLLVVLAACSPNTTFEAATSIPAATWDYDLQPEAVIDIQDTAASYDVYLVVRHTTEYPFSNLWLNLHTTYPSGKTGVLREQVFLGNNESQQWNTDCLREVCTGLLPIIEGHRFTEPGTYQFRLEHIMRTNPLPGIMDIGLRIEKKPTASA